MPTFSSYVATHLAKLDLRTIHSHTYCFYDNNMPFIIYVCRPKIIHSINTHWSTVIARSFSPTHTTCIPWLAHEREAWGVVHEFRASPHLWVTSIIAAVLITTRNTEPPCNDTWLYMYQNMMCELYILSPIAVIPKCLSQLCVKQYALPMRSEVPL